MRTPEDVPTDPDALLRYGRVASVDLGNARCTVALDGDVQTPPLRWIAPRMGETRAWLPPSVGEQVLVLCPGGEIGAGLVLGGITSTANPAPIDQPTPLMTFKDGAVLSYDPDAHELRITLPSGGKVSITADVAITGKLDVTDKVTSEVDVVGAGISLKDHKHGSVQAGSADTGAPK